jgi:hypothetical protein
VHEILGDLGRDPRVEHFRQGFPEHSEKGWSCREDHSVEAILEACLLELRGDPASEQKGLALARSPLSAGAVMPDSSASPAGGGVIEDTAGAVRFEVAIMQVRIRIRNPTGEYQWRTGALDIIKASFALISDDNSHTHHSLPFAAASRPRVAVQHLSGIALSTSLMLSTAASEPVAIKPARTFTLMDLRASMADTPPLDAVRAAPAGVLRACI